MDRVMEEHLSTSDFVATGEREERREEEHREEEGDQRTAAAGIQEENAGPLLPRDCVQDLRGRWDRIQSMFVDEPRSAVQQADELVATAIKRLAETFSEQRTGLEGQWDRGDNVSTEDLRVALRKYRAFFQRLLAV